MVKEVIVGEFMFNWLFKYHCQFNMPNWLKNAKIENGKIVSKHGISLEEGIDENPYTKGFLVLVNGDTLVNRLKEEEIVIDKVIPPWETIYNEKEFFEYVNRPYNGKKKRSRESAYVVNISDEKKIKITNVREFNNNIKKDIIFAQYLPKKFLSEDRIIDPDDTDEGIGLKTRNAIRTAVVYPDVNSYQIKASPFGNAKMGIVAHNGNDGLIQTYHMEHRPEEDLPYINEKFKIVAIHRKYGRNEKGEKVCVYQSYYTKI